MVSVTVKSPTPEPLVPDTPITLTVGGSRKKRVYQSERTCLHPNYRYSVGVDLLLRYGGSSDLRRRRLWGFSRSWETRLSRVAPVRHSHQVINQSLFSQRPVIMNNGLTIVQSSSSQSALPVLKELISSSKDRILFFSFLYPPELFAVKQDNLTVFDWTDRIPGYSDGPLDLLDHIPTGKSPVA